MWNFVPWIVLPGSIYFLVLGRSLKDWRAKAQALAGLAGLLWVGLSIGIRSVPLLACFTSLKAMAGGVLIGILVTLWLEGSTKPVHN